MTRVSIRVMMLIVLIVALLLGWQVNKVRQQREAVAAVKRYGGWVHYDYEFVNGTLTSGQSPSGAALARKTLGDEFFQNVRQVSLVYDNSTGKRFENSNVQPCDGLLKQISGLPGLKELLLTNTQATDEGLRSIGKMTGLEVLYIWDGKSVTDAGVSHLANLRNLKTIHINRSNLSNDSLVLLSGLPSIESLSLQANYFSDEGLARLHGEDRLKQLFIGLGHGRITDEGMVYLRDFKRLKTLDLQYSEVTRRDSNNSNGCRA